MTQDQPPALLGTAHEQPAEATDQSGASALSNEQLAGLISDLSAQLTEIKAENAELRQKLPSYKPMDRMDPHNFEERRRQIEALGHEQVKGADMTMDQGKWIGVTSGFGIAGVEGNRVPENMVQFLGKRFSEGDYVRINPDVTREGAQQSWGELLQKLGSDGIGQVTQVLDFRKCGQWKYKVRIPRVGGRGGQDGFYDRELLPA